MASMLHRLLSRSAAGAVLLLLLLPLSAIATDIESCPDLPVKFTSVQISLNPVMAGTEATFNVSANTGDEISSGRLEVITQCFPIPQHDSYQICDLTTCPVSVGDFTLLYKQVLPQPIQRDSCSVTANLVDQGGNELGCFFFEFNVAN